MKRRRLNHLINLYLDDEIAPNQLHELNQALEGSEECRRYFKHCVFLSKAFAQCDSPVCSAFSQHLKRFRALFYMKCITGGVAVCSFLLVSLSLFEEKKGLPVQNEEDVPPLLLAEIRQSDSSNVRIRDALNHADIQEKLHILSFHDLKRKLEANPEFLASGYGEITARGPVKYSYASAQANSANRN